MMATPPRPEPESAAPPAKVAPAPTPAASVAETVPPPGDSAEPARAAAAASAQPRRERERDRDRDRSARPEKSTPRPGTVAKRAGELWNKKTSSEMIRQLRWVGIAGFPCVLAALSVRTRSASGTRTIATSVATDLSTPARKMRMASATSRRSRIVRCAKRRGTRFKRAYALYPEDSVRSENLGLRGAAPRGLVASAARNFRELTRKGRSIRTRAPSVPSSRRRNSSRWLRGSLA